MSVPLNDNDRNKFRRERAMNALHAFEGDTFDTEPLQAIVTDLLADIMHLQGHEGDRPTRGCPLNVSLAYYNATRHYLAERAGGDQ